jgi:flagellin
MTRINSNVASLLAQANLTRANQNMDTRLQRLATGLRINRGADDPAGLIVSERLRSEINGFQQGIRNSERAANVIRTSEASLAEVNDLLNSIKALVVEAANTGAFSQEEILANQLQIDSAIDSITRISNTASFAGLQLLNGSLGYQVSGVDPNNIVKTKVYGAAFYGRENVQIDVEVLNSAQTGSLFLNTNFTSIHSGYTNGVLPSNMTVEIAGPGGVTELTFVSGTSIDDVIAAINLRTPITGVEAVRQSVTDPSSGIIIRSVDFGKNAFVSVERLSGGTAFTFAKNLDNVAGPAIDWSTPATWTTASRDAGRDVVALLNGSVVTGSGINVALRNPELDIEIQLSKTFGTTITGTPETFHITSGGSTYQLGPRVNAQQQVNIGIDSVAATRLGGSYVQQADGSWEVQFLSSLKTGGPNALMDGNLMNASTILEKAIDEITIMRGRLGAFERNVLDTNIRSLQASVENLSASESIIRDADFAKETSELSRAQILVQSGTSVLAMANQNAQNVLQLLG